MEKKPDEVRRNKREDFRDALASQNGSPQKQTAIKLLMIHPIKSHLTISSQNDTSPSSLASRAMKGGRPPRVTMNKARRFLVLMIKTEGRMIGGVSRIVEVCYAPHWKEAEAEANRLGAFYEQAYPGVVVAYLVYSWQALRNQGHRQTSLKIYNHDNFLEGLPGAALKAYQAKKLSQNDNHHSPLASQDRAKKGGDHD